MSTKSVAYGAVVTILLFPIAVIVLNLLQSPPYDPIAQAASQLALGTAGWMMVVGFCGLAVGTLLVAFVLGRTLGRNTALPVVLLALAGLLGFIPAVFPTDGPGAQLSTHGLIHNLTGVVTFILYVAAMVSSVFAFKQSAYWQPLRRVTKIWAGAGIVAFLLIVAFGKSNLFGLTERIALVVFISWLITVAVRAIAEDDG